MHTIKVDLRFKRVGSTWCCIALVKTPGCPEPLEIITCLDANDFQTKTGASAAESSAVTRTKVRDQALDSVVESLGKDAPHNMPIVMHMAETFDAFKSGMRVCAAAMRNDPRAMLAIVDLHRRAEHEHDADAQKQLALLRQCLEACMDGRCSFQFSIAPAGVATAGLNPRAGLGAHDMASGLNPRAGLGAHDMASGWGRDPQYGVAFRGETAGLNPRAGLGAHDMASGLNPRAGLGAHDMASGMGILATASGLNPRAGLGAHDMASGWGHDPNYGVAFRGSTGGLNPSSGLGARDMASGMNPYPGRGAPEMQS
jgi:hypothetical protein